MPEKLKRCPCCGGKAEIRYHQIPTQGRSAYQISCSRCVLATSWIGSPEEVIYFWNRRVGNKAIAKAEENEPPDEPAA